MTTATNFVADQRRGAQSKVTHHYDAAERRALCGSDVRYAGPIAAPDHWHPVCQRCEAIRDRRRQKG